MKQIATTLFLAGVLSGCNSGPQAPDLTADDFTYQIQTSEELLEVQTSELGTDKIHDRAKTVEWANISTDAGTRYLGGSILVDRVLRYDAANLYGVKVRLKNTTAEPLFVEFQVNFFDADGIWLIGLRNPWKKIAIDPFRLRTVKAAARRTGAVGFRIHIRAAGGDGSGGPDG